MKRFWTMALLLCLLAAGAVVAWRHWPRTVPLEQCSEVYRRYADDGHVAATFLRNFRVNDSVEVDVTLLEARDDEGWERLQKDFNATPPPPEVIEILGENSDEVWVWLAPKSNYALPIDSVMLNNDVLSISFEKRQMCIFAIENEQQIKAVSIHQFEEGHTPIKNKNK